MPRTSSSGSFAGVYAVGQSAAVAGEETAYVGAVMTFQQTTAPTGWTKSTTHDDAVLTVTTGTISDGGLTGFSTIFNGTATVSGSATFGSMTIGNTTMTGGMLPTHTHAYSAYPSRAFTASPPTGSPTRIGLAGGAISPGAITGYTGPTAHGHPNPVSGLNSGPANLISKSMGLKYVDVIIATKN